MSIPTNQLVYAGVYDVTKRYPNLYFVVSPIDSQCYINTNVSPAQGTPDPSVQPSSYWTFFPNVTGDITGITAGTGIAGGGSTGNVTISNTGVLSLDGQTGAVTTKCGGWHRNSNQTISTTGAPSFVSLSWGQSSYGDTTTISQNVAGGSTFTVNQHGIYAISIQFQYANLGSATLTDRTLRCIMNCNRGGNTATILTGTYDFPDNVPTNPTQQCNGVYELQVGDQITIQSVQYLLAGSFTLNGQSAAPVAFDYNTFWNWTLIQPLP